MIPTRPDPRLVAQVTKLLAAVRDEAQRSNVAPELLATRRDVEQLVFSGRADHLMEGWRRDVIGQRLVALAAESANA
jgi:ribonuclease D